MVLKISFLALFILIPFRATHAQVYEFSDLVELQHFKVTEETEVLDKVPQDSLFALKSYMDKDDSYYSEINDYLRYWPKPYTWYGTSPVEAKKDVLLIDKIFEIVPLLPKNLILFRGIDLSFRGDSSFIEGEVIENKGYSSTSTSQGIAKMFTRIGDKHGKSALLILYFNKARHGILIDADEDEVLLERNLKMKVMRKKMTKDQDDIYLVQVCSNVCSEAIGPVALQYWSTL